MNHGSAPLSNEKVGVIGFNARPIAASLSRLGAEVYVSDYWGDSDLKESSFDCIAVLSPTAGIRQRQPLNTPLPDALVDNFLLMTDGIEIGFVVIGSGFDDDTNSLRPVVEKFTLKGNTISKMEKSRRTDKINKFALNVGLNRPKETITSFDEYRNDVSDVGFPCLLRPLKSGGGRGIRLARGLRDLQRYAQKYSDGNQKFKLQQYIRGADISTSVLGSQTKSLCISVQGQLIGMPTAGLNCGFAYCGNYFPAPITQEVREDLSRISEELCCRLGLVGSNGFDFVVDSSSRAWLMEVNPRIQGTMEMLESAGPFSVIDAHISAMEGKVPNKKPTFSPVVKMIVYSRRLGRIPNLTQYAMAVDRSPPGVIVHRGDPVCTLIDASDSLACSYQRISGTASSIQNSII